MIINQKNYLGEVTGAFRPVFSRFLASFQLPLNAGRNFLEVEADTDFESDGATATEIVHTHAIVNGRFDGNVVVEIERITDFKGDEHVVVVVRAVGILSTCAEVEAVMGHIVASTCAQRKVIRNIGVLIACIGLQHEVVHDEITGLCTKSEAQFVFAAITQIQARGISTNIGESLLKLCTCGDCCERENRDGK